MTTLHSILAAVLLGCVIVPSLSCSQDSFALKARECVDGFFENLKKPSQNNCSVVYAQFLNCTNQEMSRCINQSKSKQDSASILSRARALIATEKYFCEDGLLNSLDQYKPVNLPSCRKNLFKKTQKCALSFRETFKKDKRSGSLCRKYSKAKSCLKRALEKSCKITPQVERLVSLYKQPYNPYCPGKVDQRRKQSRHALDNPFGACTTKSYMVMTRMCVVRFIQTLQGDAGKTCRWAFANKLQACVKTILLHCLKKSYESSEVLNKNIDASLARQRAYQEQNYCFGKGLSTPSLQANQCKENYQQLKEKCEETYLKAYRKNIADKSLCRKYARAKRCTKRATLLSCRVTPDLKYEVEFLYDQFNPFCFNLTDPPKRTSPRKIRTSEGLNKGHNTTVLSGEAKRDSYGVARGGPKERIKREPSGALTVNTYSLGLVLGLTLFTLAFYY